LSFPSFFSSFFSLPRPPPRSTLFPYTTLFRSSYATKLLQGLVESGLEGGAFSAVHLAAYHVGARFARSRGRGVGGAVVHDENRQDRKSTRLNSSHVSISYAVFCLKKKKKKKI